MIPAIVLLMIISEHQQIILRISALRETVIVYPISEDSILKPVNEE
jgi:hypothetical protein